MGRDELLYDWNILGGETPERPRRIELDDETLRDGLQSPSVRCPTTGEKIELLHHMVDLGIQAVDIGYAGAGEQTFLDVVALAREIGDQRLPIEPNCAGRTHASDIDPIAEAQQRTGVAIEAAVFLGSSPIRRYAEGWDFDFLLDTTDRAVRYARSLGLEVMYVTEDTTRAHPDDLRRLYTTAIEAGARRICFSDTVGHATPWGVSALISFGREIVEASGEDVKIDFHGHRDRGLSIPNSLAALAAGADRTHGCALGIGERCGNTPMDILLVNLKLLGWWDGELDALPAYCETASKITDTPIPVNYPAIGKDAFETSTGVHAAAVLKALRKGDTWLANRVYSGVPADMIGRGQVITVGPMSGRANAEAWLMQHGLPIDPEAVERILEAAKASNRVLTEEEMAALLGANA